MANANDSEGGALPRTPREVDDRIAEWCGHNSESGCICGLLLRFREEVLGVFRSVLGEMREFAVLAQNEGADHRDKCRGLAQLNLEARRMLGGIDALRAYLAEPAQPERKTGPLSNP